jgi:translation initiation factor eIF-2B subunit beta
MEDLSASTGSVTFASQVQILNQGQGQGQGQGYSSPRSESEDFMRQSGRLKPVLVQAIEEVVGELETTHEDVAKGAREHVHSS